MNITNKKTSPVARFWQPVILLIMVVLGIVLHYSGVLDWEKILHWAQRESHHWWIPIVLISLQILLFTLAMPGSAMLLVVAPLYSPGSATLILTTGSTLGALGAYLFARRETLTWSQRVKDNHLFHVLEQRGDFLSLCAIRLIPAFPHSVINYSAGILHLSIAPFILSSMIGLGTKSFLYSNAIYGAIQASNLYELIRFDILGPLLFLAVISAVAAYFHSRNSRHRN
ncbi:TVP38/TMEM64 family protein [Kaarinaea lacus]